MKNILPLLNNTAGSFASQQIPLKVIGTHRKPRIGAGCRNRSVMDATAI
jgi:hypothetical protein